MEETLLYFSLKYQGNFSKILSALKNKEKVDEALKEMLFQTMKCQYTTIISEDYPPMLKEINCPPFVLYYYGHLEYLNEYTLAVIGKRNPSEYGKYVCDTLITEVAKEVCIVSGMAKGIDGLSHRASMAVNGHTVAILGSGIDYVYPKSNIDIYQEMKENQLIISEYPGDTPPQKEYFPQRNRLISGLSYKIVVVEADIKSGTMITVGFALEQGKDVLCVPGRINDAPGCNKMIQQGAKLIMNIEDILEEISFVDK